MPARNPTLKALLWLVAGALLIAMLMRYVDLGVAQTVRAWPKTVVAVFEVVTLFGWHYWYWPSGAVAAVMFAALSRRATAGNARLYAWAAEASAFLFAVTAVSNFVVGVVKHVVGRARPYVNLPPDGPAFTLFASTPDHWSFPSGHACTFLAVAMVAAFLWPRRRWPILAAGVTGAFSRVVLDVHYLSDILAGGSIGVITALLMREWFANRGWAFRRRPDGSITVKPGGRWVKRRLRRNPGRRRG
ncbi:MAG TPA: phosphatase PAP2 family protein [Azospirillum sp.]|nr:phosphatase PAP2 family protein [Azospirillum sp.]